MPNHCETSSEIPSPPEDTSAGRKWRDCFARLAPSANRMQLIQLLSTTTLALDVAHARAAAVDRELITSRAALDTLAATVEQATRDARRLSDEAARIRLTNAITDAVRVARTAVPPTS